MLERKALARQQRRVEDRTEAQSDPDARTPHRAKSTRQSGKYRLEYRCRPDKLKSFRLFETWTQWKTYHRHYATPGQRDEAMRAMNRKDTLFEYKVKE